MVVKQDIVEALKNVGINDTDTVIFHSSLKSFGEVDGGAETVIYAIKECLKNGTVVFPALRQKNILNAYDEWDIENTPSDVGLISETFRKQKGVLRSDQATHSVCAIGRHAEFITSGHSDGQGRIGIYGSTPFSHSSPWQKMLDLGGKVVLLGVGMETNTFNHFVEYSFIDDTLEMLNGNEKETAKNQVLTWRDYINIKTYGKSVDGVWFWTNVKKVESDMREQGLFKQTFCGNCLITAFNVKDFYEISYNEIKSRNNEWIKKYRRD